MRLAFVAILTLGAALTQAQKPCRYRKGVWSPCGADKQKTRQLTLFRGNDNCLNTTTETKKCGGKKGMRCKYEKGTWSDCSNGVRSRTLTRKTNSADSCDAEKVITKVCRKGNGCKYRKTSKGPCNMNMRTVHLTLKKGDREKCAATQTKEKKCKSKKNKPSKLAKQDCNYVGGEWSECDLRTDTMQQSLTLETGDVNKCPPNKIIHKKCKKACKFRKGKWSACNLATHLKERNDILIGGNEEDCSKTRTITKHCRYSKNKNNKKSKKNKKNKRKNKKKNKKKIKKRKQRKQRKFNKSAPRDITIIPSEDDPRLVQVNWQPPIRSLGQITDYVIFFTNDLHNLTSWVTENVQGEKLSAVVENLTLNMTYYFKVQAKTTGGPGAVSTIVSYSTPVS